MRVTLLNRLKHQDSQSNKDEWYKTVLDVKVKRNKVTSIVGTDVSMGEECIVLIPFSDKYRHYENWETNSTYTMSQGDLIFFNEFDDSLDNVAKLKTKYNALEVRVVEEAPKNAVHHLKYQLKVSGVC